jgi:hypothetical protein
MIDHLNNLLRHLFISRIDEITEEGQVRYQPPDQDWRSYVGGLTQNALNIYLVELSENHRLRSNERIREVQNSVVSETPAPRRMDCHYLITAWSPATVSQAVDPTSDEHALLYKVAGVLMNHDVLNPRQVYSPDPLPSTFPAAISDAELPMVVMPADGFSKLAEFWGTVEGQWRPALHIVVTLPVLLAEQPAGTMVTSRITEYRVSTRPGTETGTPFILVQIAGRVFDVGNPVHSVEGADVKLVERNRTTVTDARGRFSIGGLPPGNYTLEVSKAGFTPQTTGIVVPADTPNAYDVGLSP